MRGDAAALAAALEREAKRLGFAAAGITRVAPSEHAAFFRKWIAEGRHGEMAWLARDDAVRRRLDPVTAWPELSSILVVAESYADGSSEDSDDPSRGIIARYARGRDYHRTVKKKLFALLRWLEAETGRAMPEARAYVDTGPVLEREVARRAGLGWYGRNTMLIHPERGSYFFLAALILPLELPEDAPFSADRCGTCNACVEACPTGALLGRDANGAPLIDARRCISYLTIEHRGAIPVELRGLMGNRVFGCDICQEVCPWNGSGGRERRRKRLRGREWGRDGIEGARLVELMRMTREEWDEWTRGTALRRAGYAGFRRNVAIALGNWLTSLDAPPKEAVAALRDAVRDEEPVVREHTAWALEQARS